MSGEQMQAEQSAVEEQGSGADFDSGFSGNTGATTTPAPTPAPSPEPTPAPTPAPSSAPAAPEYVQVTRGDWERLQQGLTRIDEIQAATKKQFDTAFGQMGAFQQKLAKLQTETPAGEAVQIDHADFKELKDAYPELGDATLLGLNRMLTKLKGTAGAPVDQAAIQKLVDDQVQKVAGNPDQMLNAIVPRWRDKVKTPEFATWLKGQPLETQRLADSGDANDAAELLHSWRDRSRAAAAPVPTPAPAPTATPVSSRQRQIAAAVQPKGDGGQPPASADPDDFDAGFKYRSG